MLDYLVTSTAKKQLLRLLWLEKAEAPMRQLASRAGLSFSTVYEELKAMELGGLALSEHRGASVVYRANRGHPSAALLLELLRTVPRSDTQTPAHHNEVLSNLERLGAPLGLERRHAKLLSKEQTLFQALKLARTSATVARVLPLVFHRHWKELDLDALESLAVRSGEKRTLGFFLDLTAELAHDKDLRERAARLLDKRVRRSERFFRNAPSGRYLDQLEKKNTPDLARKWRFTMNMPLEAFASHFEKFTRAAEDR